MKEYNWREEREKFRPDFQKKEQPSTPQTAAPEPVRSSSGKWSILVGVIVIAALAVVGVFILKGKDSTTRLAEVAEKHKKAVGLVTLTIELQNGKKIEKEVE